MDLLLGLEFRKFDFENVFNYYFKFDFLAYLNYLEFIHKKYQLNKFIN